MGYRSTVGVATIWALREVSFELDGQRRIEDLVVEVRNRRRVWSERENCASDGDRVRVPSLQAAVLWLPAGLDCPGTDVIFVSRHESNVSARGFSYETFKRGAILHDRGLPSSATTRAVRSLIRALPNVWIDVVGSAGHTGKGEGEVVRAIDRRIARQESRSRPSERGTVAQSCTDRDIEGGLLHAHVRIGGVADAQSHLL